MFNRSYIADEVDDNYYRFYKLKFNKQLKLLNELGRQKYKLRMAQYPLNYEDEDEDDSDIKDESDVEDEYLIEPDVEDEYLIEPDCEPSCKTEDGTVGNLSILNTSKIEPSTTEDPPEEEPEVELLPHVEEILLIIYKIYMLPLKILKRISST